MLAPLSLCVVAGKGAAFVGGTLALLRGAESTEGALSGTAATRPGGCSGCPARRAPLLRHGGLLGLRGGRLDAGAEGRQQGPMGGRSGAPAGGAQPGLLLRVAEFGVPPVLFVLLTVRVVSDPAATPEAVTFLTAACAAMMSECVTFPMVCSTPVLSHHFSLSLPLPLSPSLSLHACVCVFA